MADLTEFSRLSWTESGQNLDRWGYPHRISQNPDPTVPVPPDLGYLFPYPMHSNLLIGGKHFLNIFVITDLLNTPELLSI